MVEVNYPGTCVHARRDEMTGFESTCLLGNLLTFSVLTEPADVLKSTLSLYVYAYAYSLPFHSKLENVVVNAVITI